MSRRRASKRSYLVLSLERQLVEAKNRLLSARRGIEIARQELKAAQLSHDEIQALLVKAYNEVGL